VALENWRWKRLTYVNVRKDKSGAPSHGDRTPSSQHWQWLDTGFRILVDHLGKEVLSSSHQARARVTISFLHLPFEEE